MTIGSNWTVAEYVADMIGLIERLTAYAEAIETVISEDHTPASA